MPMTVVVTNNVAYRFRGFLASCMLEVASGVYSSPRMSVAVRQRVQAVLADWYAEFEEGWMVMVWPDSKEAGGQGLFLLGQPPRHLVDYEGLVLSRRLPLTGGLQ